MIIAIYLRSANIISEQLSIDEAISISFANSSFDKFWNLLISDIHPPLFYIIL